MAAGRRLPRSRLLWVLAAAFALSLGDLPWPSAGPPLDWQTDLDAALADARRSARPALISFHADWCSICKRLDRHSLRAPEIAAELERFVIVRVDATKLDPGTQELLTRFGVTGLPALVFIDPNGQTLQWPRARGFMQREPLLELLRSVG
ncbi:MAG: thioredoxin family protein [Myxococcales bacterium]|nr:thioredoxin family protein [Myxococcales bacterium]